MPDVFGIAGDILIVGHDGDGRVHDRALRQVIQICHQENLKLDKISVISGIPRYKILFFGDVISR